MAEVRVYPCPGSSGRRTLDPSLRDCPEVDMGAVGTGEAQGSVSRFLGMRSRFIPEEEYLAQFASAPSVEAESVDTRKILWLALGLFAIFVLFLFARRRRK